MFASEGLRKGAWGNGLDVLGLRTNQNLRLGQKTRDGNLERQSFGPLEKSAMGISPTCLEVKVSPM